MKPIETETEYKWKRMRIKPDEAKWSEWRRMKLNEVEWNRLKSSEIKWNKVKVKEDFEIEIAHERVCDTKRNNEKIEWKIKINIVYVNL